LIKKLLLLVLILPVMFACDEDTSTQDENEIRDIIYDISRDFSWNEIEGIMEHVHPDYLHDGMYDYQLWMLWQDRMADYDLLACDVSYVDIQGDYATVHMVMDFESSDGSYSYPEPETSGDASFFYYDYNYGEWMLYGNQLYDRQ
jgi:hypothetical protein